MKWHIRFKAVMEDRGVGAPFIGKRIGKHSSQLWKILNGRELPLRAPDLHEALTAMNRLEYFPELYGLAYADRVVSQVSELEPFWDALVELCESAGRLWLEQKEGRG